MGFTEILTGIFILLKLYGVISWSWFFVFLPEIIALFIYIPMVVCMVIMGAASDRELRKLMKQLKEDHENGSKKQLTESDTKNELDSVSD